MEVLITAGVVTVSIIIASALFWLDGSKDNDTIDRTYYDDKDDNDDEGEE